MTEKNAEIIKPWYKQFWPWIIIGLLAYSVVRGLTLLTIATSKTRRGWFNDDYTTSARHQPVTGTGKPCHPSSQLHANLLLNELTGTATLQLNGNSRLQQLVLNLISPTQPERDRRVILQPQADGSYSGQMSMRCKVDALLS